MAVEIRELVIKAVITNDGDEEEDGPSVTSDSFANKDEIIQECVNQVLRIIRKSKSR